MPLHDPQATVVALPQELDLYSLTTLHGLLNKIGRGGRATLINPRDDLVRPCPPDLRYAPSGPKRLIPQEAGCALN
jgi:hypothetical protein